ncbi:unnamed protein product [Musa textilis]
MAGCVKFGSSGLLVSWMMKHADNIVKRRSGLASPRPSAFLNHCMALLLTMVLSIFFFISIGLISSSFLQLLLGIIICMISLHMYFAPAQTLVDLPATTNLALDTLKEIAAEQRGES